MTLLNAFSISEAEIYFHWNFIFHSATLEDNQAQKDKKNFPLKSKCYWQQNWSSSLLLFVTKVLSPKIQDKLLNSIWFPIPNKPQLEAPGSFWTKLLQGTCRGLGPLPPHTKSVYSPVLEGNAGLGSQRLVTGGEKWGRISRDDERKSWTLKVFSLASHKTCQLRVTGPVSAGAPSCSFRPPPAQRAGGHSLT